MAQKVGRNARMGRRDGGDTGAGLSFGNPGEERRLAARLSKIDREKRKRESAMSWNQRSFFMKQVFDQDDELRFVKAAQRPKYLKNIPPPPRDGDNSWMKEEYVFSFKPKTSTSPEGKDRGTHGELPLEDSSNKQVAGEVGDQAKQENLVMKDTTPEELSAEAAAEAAKAKELEELEKKEQEKRDLANSGVFGSRRDKMKMPLLMTGAWKQKSEPDIKPEETIVETVTEINETVETEADIYKDSKDEVPDPLNQSKSNATDTAEAAKPRTRFPVLKVRALGLFAMTFKKPTSGPQAPQCPPQAQSQPANDLKLSPISNPDKDTSLLTASLPQQTEPAKPVKARSPPPPKSALIPELQSSGSVSLPNSPLNDRKPQLVRQQSDHTLLVKSTERTKSDKLKRVLKRSESGHNFPPRSSRRDSTAKSNHEHTKRHSVDGATKSIKSASHAMPKHKREGTAKTSFSSTLPVTDSSHIWGTTNESENQDKEPKKNANKRAEDNSDEEVDYHVIRRIVRTLPAHLMLKTSKREVEAGGDVALLRQKMMDLARADTTRRASLDPRFKKLEKSLCNSP